MVFSDFVAFLSETCPGRWQGLGTGTALGCGDLGVSSEQGTGVGTGERVWVAGGGLGGAGVWAVIPGLSQLGSWGVPVILGEILGLSQGASDPWVLGIPEVSVSWGASIRGAA